MSNLIKSQEDIKQMRESGRIAALILDELKKAVKPGVTTKDLDTKARELIEKYNVKPAFLNYDGFPGVLCTSVNDVVVHGVPSNQPLKEGDILGLDFGVVFNGWYSDLAVTLPVGKISYEAKHLINVTKKALRLAIKKAKPGNTTGDIGNTIQRYVGSEGYSVVKDLVGHGVGKNLHENPQVPNWGKRGAGLMLEKGMVIAIEPMVVLGNSDAIELAHDKFGYKSKEKFLTAQFEHTIEITSKNANILTKI